MDKVILKKQDIEDLLVWRDNHIFELRSLTADRYPVKAIEIDCTDVELVIKCYKNGKKISFYIYKITDNHCYGRFLIEIIPDGRCKLLKRKLEEDYDSSGFIHSVLTVYTSLMALMAHGYVYQGEKEENAHPIKKTKKITKTHTKKEQSNNKQSVIYLFKFKNGEPKVTVKGSHMSPSGIFSVRGHFRHYQDGKVIWVSEYKKGTGKKKNKLYKLKGRTKNE